MTKIQIHFRLLQPLDEAAMAKLSDSYAVYGIQKIQLADTMDAITVEYDATRLRPAEVESVFACAGIAVERA